MKTKSLLIALLLWHCALPLKAQLQLASAKIKGLTKVDFNKSYEYELVGVKGNMPKGKWQLIPPEAGEISNDSANTTNIIWKNYCSKAIVKWSLQSNPNVGFTSTININACPSENPNCTLTQPFKAGNSTAKTQFQNGILVQYKCDTFNQIITAISLDEYAESIKIIGKIKNIAWYIHQQKISNQKHFEYLLAAGNEVLKLELTDSLGKLTTNEFNLVVPTANFLELKNVPSQPICKGNTINLEAVAKDNRIITNTKWQLDNDWFWFQHLVTSVKLPTAGNVSTVMVSSMDEYGCVNETSAAITISSGFGLTVNTFFDRSLPDSAALLKPDTIGIIQSNVFGGTAPYQYQWFEKENTNGKAISTSHQLKITNSIANTSQSESATYYLLKITDKYGCEAISNATLNPLIFRKRYREWKNRR